MLLRRSILSDYTLSLDTRNGIHWTVLLRFAKASKRFLRPCGLLGLRTGPKLRPQRWCALCTCPEGKVRIPSCHPNKAPKDDSKAIRYTHTPRFVLNQPIFLELLHVRPVSNSKLLVIAVTDLSDNALHVAQPTASNH